MVQLSAMVLAIGVPVAKTMPPPAFQQPLCFQEQVGGPLAFGGVGQSLHAFEPGGEGKVLPPVHLVHEGAVDPQVFEGHGLRQTLAVLQAPLAAQESSGEPLDGFLN